jgi:hypothetical protein
VYVARRRAAACDAWLASVPARVPCPLPPKGGVLTTPTTPFRIKLLRRPTMFSCLLVAGGCAGRGMPRGALPACLLRRRPRPVGNK